MGAAKKWKILKDDENRVAWLDYDASLLTPVALHICQLWNDKKKKNSQY